MEKKVCEVKKIVLNIDGKEISLTMEQAKKLKDILGELFEKEIVKEIVKEEHHHYDRPYYPIWVYEPIPYNPLQPQIWCQSGGTYSSNNGSLNFNL